LRIRRDCDEVQQENQEIVCLTCFHFQRFFVHNFEIDQPRAAGVAVKNHVICTGVAVRPTVAKFIAPELMSAPEFVASCFHHSFCERAML